MKRWKMLSPSSILFLVLIAMACPSIAGTRENILAALRELATSLDKNDALVIYFAGHGVEDKISGHGYWIPSDAFPNKLLQRHRQHGRTKISQGNKGPAHIPGF